MVISGSQNVDNSDEVIKMVHFAIACQKLLHYLITLIKLDSNYNPLSTTRFTMHVATFSESMRDSLDYQTNFRNILDRAFRIQQYVPKTPNNIQK